MTDPVTIAALLKSAGSVAGGRVGANLVTRAADWLKGEEFDRVLKVVAERLGTDVGVVGLAPLREDPTIAALVAALIDDPGTWDERELIKAIEPYVGQLTPEGSPTETAEKIARIIRREAWRALSSDREAVVYAVRSEVGGIAQLVTPRFLSEEWIPRQALEPVRRLAKDQPTEAQRLEEALADKSRRTKTVVELIANPQPWVEGGSVRLWTTLAELALAYGEAGAAETALVEASDRAGADRARFLSRASQVAFNRGQRTRADELLALAREIEPDHPAVALTIARREPDPTRRLVLLEKIEPQDEIQAIGIESDRALALLSLRDFENARLHASLVSSKDPESPITRELVPLITLIEGVYRTQDEIADHEALVDAASGFLSLRDELLELGRFQESVRMLVRAAEAYVAAGDSRAARRALDSLSEAEIAAADSEARAWLAEALLDAGRPAEAMDILEGASGDDQTRLLRAQALLATGSTPDEEPLKLLSELITTADDQNYRAEAARIWLAMAVSSDDVPWNDEAHDVVRTADPVLADILMAAKLKRDGDTGEAKKLLLLRQEDSRALELLAEIAAAEGDHTTVLRIDEKLLECGATPERRLRHAKRLEESGDTRASLEALAALRSDVSATPDLRTVAYALSADRLEKAGKFIDLVSVARAWRTFQPDEDEAGWALAGGLAHLARWEEALEVIEGRDLGSGDCRKLKMTAEGDAILTATVLANALPPAESITRIAEISDEFNRKIERLETLIIFVGLAVEDLPKEVNERRRAALREFAERFPDSQSIKSFEGLNTTEDIEEFFREQLAPGSEIVLEMQKSVLGGKAPVSALAGAAGKSAADLWTSLLPLPLGFGDPALNDLERADAEAAFGKPTVWDTSALYVAGGLGNEVISTIKSHLPASVVAQSVLDDVVVAAGRPTADTAGEQTVVGWDPVLGKPTVAVVPAEEVARTTAALGGMLDIARSLRVTEDADPTNPGRFDEFLTREDGERPPLSLLGWPATFAIAERLGLPIYSDDRFIRLEARRAGIPSFGTAALMDVLVNQGVLEEEVRDAARRRLRLSFAMGLVPAPADLVEEARAAEWDIDPLVARALHDPTGWRIIDVGLRSKIPLLIAAFNEAPDQLGLWVARVIDAACSAYETKDASDLAAALLAFCWMVPDVPFARAVTGEVIKLRTKFAMIFDPIKKAFMLVLGSLQTESDQVRLMAIRRALRSVPSREQRTLFFLIA